MVFNSPGADTDRHTHTHSYRRPHDINFKKPGVRCTPGLKSEETRKYKYTVYAVIFEGRKFHGFRCKLVERKILILEKKQWLKETMYSTW